MSGRRKHLKRKGKKRLTYWIIAIILIFLGFLIYYSLQKSNQTSSNHETPQAAIVDQLDFTGQSNLTFVGECINILEEGGLTWAYYKGEDITVDFYRNLPSYGTSLIILRVHSAIMKTENGTISILGLFTSELYLGPEDAARKYPEDVEHNRLVRAFFTEGGPEYYGIVPEFVEESMIGEFRDAVIIMMGCEGLGYDGVPYTDMAKAFINKGARVYIGWNGPVSINHTDQETLDLLQNLIAEKQTIKEAVEKADPDTSYNSELKFYPSGAANYVIPNVRSNLTTTLLNRPPRRNKFWDGKTYKCSCLN